MNEDTITPDALDIAVIEYEERVWYRLNGMTRDELLAHHEESRQIEDVEIILADLPLTKTKLY